jgi:hypothetical protein
VIVRARGRIAGGFGFGNCEGLGAKSESVRAFDTSVLSQKFVAFVLLYLVCSELPEKQVPIRLRSGQAFGSAEVRFAPSKIGCGNSVAPTGLIRSVGAAIPGRRFACPGLFSTAPSGSPGFETDFHPLGGQKCPSNTQDDKSFFDMNIGDGTLEVRCLIGVAAQAPAGALAALGEKRNGAGDVGGAQPVILDLVALERDGLVLIHGDLG